MLGRPLNFTKERLQQRPGEHLLTDGHTLNGSRLGRCGRCDQIGMRTTWTSWPFAGVRLYAGARIRTSHRKRGSRCSPEEPPAIVAMRGDLSCTRWRCARRSGESRLWDRSPGPFPTHGNAARLTVGQILVKAGRIFFQRRLITVKKSAII